MTHIYLVHQAGGTRVSFGICPDVQAELARLGTTIPGRLELLSVVPCRNARAAARLHQMLRDRYRASQEGEWYTLPAEEVDTLIFWFKAMNAAVSTVRSRYGLPRKQNPRSQFKKAVAWLQAHDPDLALSCRMVAAQAGVSSGTAYNAARYLLALRDAR